MITLKNIDSLKLYDQITDKIDLIITDPPYELNNGIAGKSHVKMSLKKIAQGTGHDGLDHISAGWNHHTHMAAWRKLMPKFHAFIFCSNSQISKLMHWGEERNYIVTLLCWNKINSAPLANGVWRGDAEWCIHIREKGAYFEGTAAEKCRVWQSPCVRSQYGHPTEKPEELIARYMKIGSAEGMTILDPFSGSGTTASVCHKLKRNFYGAEIHEPYYTRAIQRIEDAETNLISYHDQQLELV